MLSRKLKGGALYIALIISIVIGITLSVFILIGFYNQKKVLTQIGLNQLQNNLNSAFNIAQSEYFQEYENNRWMPIGPDNDSIRVKKLQWGAYSLISAESKNGHNYLKQCGLFGTTATNDTAILITDQDRPVALSGKIKFNGNCYFPKAGYKPVSIEGQSFNSASPINTLLRQAPSTLPVVKKSFKDELENSIIKLSSNTDSLVNELPETANNSFSAKTVVIQTGNIHVFSNQLSGNIKLVAYNSVVIESSSNLNNIFIVAPKVRIKKGFKGALNIIATDSIILEEDCFLNYPSSLTVIGSDKKNKQLNGIFVAKNSIVYGSLICLNEGFFFEQNTIRGMIKLNAGCEIYGIVYSEGYAHLQGSIYGTVFCNKLLMKTESAVYENHILNCEIDPKKYAYTIVVPGIFSQKYLNKCCKWL